MKTILTVGLPSGAEALMRNISSMVAIRIVSTFGMAVLAGMEIMLRLMGLVWMPLMGLNLACGTLVGHNLGAKKPDRAEKTALKAAYMGAVMMVGIAVFFLVFGKQVVVLFNRTEDVVQAGTSAFRIVSPFLVFLGFSVPLAGAFYGSGDTKPPMVITFVTFLLFQIPTMILMSRILGVTGVFWAYGLSMLVLCGLMVTWFFRGKWKERKLE
ncbi:MAG: hypothetical protein HXS40_14095 [Theionarchaea archaeon]|nr:hypothetical protein [Theionarchaea archaeon]